MEEIKRNLEDVNQGKTVAIVSYLTILGLVAALIMNHGKPTSIGRFHIRQSIGITVFAMALGLVSFIPIVGGILSSVAGVVVLIAFILGLLAAIQGQEKPTPIVGGLFQKWFSMI